MKRLTLDQLIKIVNILAEAEEDKNNHDLKPCWWHEEIPFSRPYVRDKNISAFHLRNDFLKLIGNYLNVFGKTETYKNAYNSQKFKIKTPLKKPIINSKISVKHTKQIISQRKSKTLKDKRDISPNWRTSKFRLSKSFDANKTPQELNSTVKSNKIKQKHKNKGIISIDWKNAKFKLGNIQPIIPKKKSMKIKQNILTKKHKKVFKSTKNTNKLKKLQPQSKAINKNAKYTLTKKTLDKLLPKAEIHLYDVFKYPTINEKEDFFFFLNLMKCEKLPKVKQFQYKKKLRNTSSDLLRNLQETRNYMRSNIEIISAANSNCKSRIEEKSTEKIIEVTVSNEMDSNINKFALANNVPTETTDKYIKNKTTNVKRKNSKDLSVQKHWPPARKSLIDIRTV